jgi:hypothetical protein
VKKPKLGEMNLHDNYRYIALDVDFVIYDSSVDFLDGFKTLKKCKLDAERWQDDPCNQNIRIKYYKGRKQIK